MSHLLAKLTRQTLFVFDKTGTLTRGRPEVVDWEYFGDPAHEKSLKQMAASVEHLSEHPISAAISNFVNTDDFQEVEDFTSFTGMGVIGIINGRQVAAGNLPLLAKLGISDSVESKKTASLFTEKGYTTIFLSVDGDIMAVAGIMDSIKEHTPSMIQKIHKMGYKTVMLTGDQEAVAKQIAGEIGINSVYAGVKPDEKASIIKKLQAEEEIVAMVGDGINDAPALMQADVGIVLGTGTDIAIESGSIILVDGNPDAVIRALNLSKQTFKKIRQNLFWAFFYNVVMIPVAVISWMHPVLAEAAMAMSSINVVGNSKRLAKKKI